MYYMSTASVHVRATCTGHCKSGSPDHTPLFAIAEVIFDLNALHVHVAPCSFAMQS